MKINIKATKIKLAPSIYEFIEKKISPLEKFTRFANNNYRSPSGKIKPSLEAFVEIEKGTHHKKGPFFRAECQLRFPRGTMRSEAVSADLRTALDDVRADLQRKLRSQKAKMAAKFKRKSRVSKKEFKITPSARFYKRERNLEEGI